MVGHLHQGRYKAIMVQKENYLLELTRYVVLNPSRAGRVKRLEDWPWSSYRAIASLNECPDWLLSQFGKRRRTAIEKYRKFVLGGKGIPSPLNDVYHQLLLGDDAFVEQYRDNKKPQELTEVSKAHQRLLALPLSGYCLDTSSSMTIEIRLWHTHISPESIKWLRLTNFRGALHDRKPGRAAV